MSTNAPVEGRDTPWMGGERPGQLASLCGFAPTPDDLYCNADAKWHGLVIGELEVESMKCCDGHLPVMQVIADYVHEVEHPCNIPGALFRWPENECYTDWDERAEFARATAMAGAA